MQNSKIGVSTEKQKQFHSLWNKHYTSAFVIFAFDETETKRNNPHLSFRTGEAIFFATHSCLFTATSSACTLHRTVYYKLFILSAVEPFQA